MDERYETEWQWFRRSVRDSLVRPRRFAAGLARGILLMLVLPYGLPVHVPGVPVYATSF